MKIALTVNGKKRRVDAPPMKRLLDVLRDECGLTGTKEGCGEGECGACSVLLDGELVNSCLVPAVQAEGRKIVTVEGLAKPAPARRRSGGRRERERATEAASFEALHPVQQAFWEQGGAQCGICTPGMLLASVDLLAKNPRPSEAEIREGLSGNLCRCTGYVKIVESVQAAAKGRRRAR